MKKTEGFTLIELLIVIAIILILIAIALPNFLEAQIRAKIAATRGDLRTVAIAMESYFTDWGMYPPDHDPDQLGPASSGLFQLTTPLKYLQQLPTDRFNSGNSGLGSAESRWYEMASTGVAPIAASNTRPVLNAYIFWSRGPDVLDNFNDNDGWPYQGPADPCPTRIGYLNYSPTNGTNSNGDLDQGGGQLNIGNYCVDHCRPVVGPVKGIGL